MTGVGRNSASMSQQLRFPSAITDKKRDSYDMSHIIPACGGWGHRERVDTRTPEERMAAEMKEQARRKGRHTKEWWKRPPDPQT